MIDMTGLKAVEGLIQRLNNGVMWDLLDWKARELFLDAKETLPTIRALIEENAVMQTYRSKMDCGHELAFLREGVCVLCENAALRAKLEAAPHAEGCWSRVGNCDCWKAGL